MTFPSKSSLNNYGDGVLIDQFTVVNPQSELTAANLNNLRNDCAAMTTTAPILHFQFTGSTTPVIGSSATWTTGWDSGWGNNNTYKPALTWNSTGNISVQLPASVPDQIGGTNLVNVRYARLSICSGSAPGFAICTVTSSSTLTIQLFDHTGAASDFTGALLVVECF